MRKALLVLADLRGGETLIEESREVRGLLAGRAH